MRVDGRHYRTIWVEEGEVRIIDQTRLPHEFTVLPLRKGLDAAAAIRSMKVRGAPCIGATAAYGVCLAMDEDPSDTSLDAAISMLSRTRPTAVNLRWALSEMAACLRAIPPADRARVAYERAAAICDDDVATCEAIGRHGLELIRHAAEERSEGDVNILTHCNAGWLACVDWGTALAPIYLAHDEGIPVHIWVDETRPRNQGAALTAWELGAHGVPYTIVADNAGGHLMRTGKVDMCIVGTDRTTANGDVANKIGTYLKALAARDNDIPFYVALPHTTIDWALDSGEDIPIEERSAEEVLVVRGRGPQGVLVDVEIAPPGSRAANFAFDVTPARLITGLVTERGVVEPAPGKLRSLYYEG